MHASRSALCAFMFVLISWLLSCSGDKGSSQDARSATYCDAVTPCTEPGLGYCDLTGAYPASSGKPNTCIPDPQQQSCSTSEPCPDEDKPHCTSSGACVACLNFSHCSTATPVCSLTTHTCGPCRSGDEGDQICGAIDPLQPFCSEAGACVECLDNTACEIVSAPICDASQFVCRGCTDTSECELGTCNPVTGVCETTE